MSVQATVAPVTVPRQAGPVDAPPAAPSPATAAAAAPAVPALLGRDRPLTPEERQFVVGISAVFVVLFAFILAALLLAQYVWA